MSNPFTAFRASDGWPLCPNCGQDQLASVALVAEVAQALADQSGFRCSNCLWTGGLSDEIRLPLATAIGLAIPDAPVSPDGPSPITPDVPTPVGPVEPLEPAVLDVPIYVEPGGPIPWPLTPTDPGA